MWPDACVQGSLLFLGEWMFLRKSIGISQAVRSFGRNASYLELHSDFCQAIQFNAIYGFHSERSAPSLVANSAQFDPILLSCLSQLKAFQIWLL
jgi:hypothetical protein